MCQGIESRSLKKGDNDGVTPTSQLQSCAATWKPKSSLFHNNISDKPSPPLIIPLDSPGFIGGGWSRLQLQVPHGSPSFTQKNQNNPPLPLLPASWRLPAPARRASSFDPPELALPPGWKTPCRLRSIHKKAPPSTLTRSPTKAPASPRGTHGASPGKQRARSASEPRVPPLSAAPWWPRLRACKGGAGETSGGGRRGKTSQWGGKLLFLQLCSGGDEGSVAPVRDSEIPSRANHRTQ